jgi:hypothetical protein
MTNVVAAHVKLGAHTGTGQKGDDWLTAPLCDGPFSNIDQQLGCHNRQHLIGERTFWNQYEQRHGQTVEKLLGELCGTSPKRHEIETLMKERANG